LAKYDAAGRHVWSETFGDLGADVGAAVAIDPQSGDILMGGTFQYNKTFGGPTFTNQGSNDIVIARYAVDSGAHVWSKAFGGPSADAVKALAVDGAGHLSAVGDFVKQIDFGGGLLTGSDLYYGDIFVLQLAP